LQFGVPLGVVLEWSRVALEVMNVADETGIIILEEKAD
jgi:hypothetical protein